MIPDIDVEDRIPTRVAFRIPLVPLLAIAFPLVFLIGALAAYRDAESL